MDEGERIAKVLARAGVFSRRDAERAIAEGRVRVDGIVLTTPAVKVTPASNIEVDGRRVGAPEPTRLWRYHKPVGLVTSHRDEQGRETIFEYLPQNLPRVISIGRLDLTSEGLLLLTNDGELARSLELPASGWSRIYRARVFGPVDERRFIEVRHGISIEGVHYGPVIVHVDRTGANSWLTIEIFEGKNREVRKVMEAIGLTVNRLIRTGFGPFELGDLKSGHVAEIQNWRKLLENSAVQR